MESDTQKDMKSKKDLDMEVSILDGEATCRIKDEKIYVPVFDSEILDSHNTGDASLDELLKMADVLLINQVCMDPETNEMTYTPNSKDKIEEEQVSKDKPDELNYNCEVRDLDDMKNLATNERPYGHLKYVFMPDSCMTGRKIKERYMCNQKMFRKILPDNNVEMMWVLEKLFLKNEDDFFNSNEEGFIKHFIQSATFETQND